MGDGNYKVRWYMMGHTKGHGMFGAHDQEGNLLIAHAPHFKNTYYYRGILNL
jgi:hypothetical protein